MSVYGSDQSDKLYPPLTPSAPEDESQTYRLKKIDEIEKFLREEINYRGKLVKRCKRRAAAMSIATAVLGISSVVTVITGVGTAVTIPLGVSTVVLGLSHKLFDSKVKKHDKIKTLAKSKLNSISSLVSKAIKDTHISHDEYHFILKEIEHYREMKEQIQAKSKKEVDKITNEQREAILAKGREEGKQDFLRKLAATSGIQTVNAM